MSAAPRILTFNFHEPYLYLMARMGWPMDIGEFDDPATNRRWHTEFRPIPKNFSFVKESVWRGDMAADRYDVVIAHNENNALDLIQYNVPKLTICHCRKTYIELASTHGREEDRKAYARLLELLGKTFTFVYISETKRDSYGIPGPVIEPGLDISEYGGYSGETKEVLRVGNRILLRHDMFDPAFQEAVCQGFASRVVGDNPDIPGSKPSESFDDLLGMFRSLRCLLHVTREEHEDGYNLAMLEAMACGMPVVSLANKTSPLTDGVDGFISHDAAVLRNRVKDLFDDIELARNIGERGRETVAKRYPMERFVGRWKEVIEEAAVGSLRNTPQRKALQPRDLSGEPPAGAAEETVDAYYQNERVEVASAVPFGVSRVLDVGCGAGALGAYLKRQGVPEVVGIEYVESACNLARKVLDNAIPGSIESLEIPYPDGYFDCVIFADVLEHLVDPAAALRKVSRVLAEDGVIIASIPNVRYYQVIGMLAGGRWEYMDAGIMDRTHLRFFAAADMRLLMESAGLEVLLQAPLSQAWPEMVQLDENRMLRMGLVTLGPLSETEFSDLRTYQYLVVAGKPGIQRLTRARLAFESQKYEEAFRRAAAAYGVDEAERHKLLAASVARLGNLAQAEELYRKAAALRPGDAEVASQLGVLLVATGRYAEAEDSLLRALSLNPEDFRALGAMGLVHAAHGRADVAFETILKSLALDFHSDGLITHAILLARQLGRAKDVVAPVGKFLDFYPGSVDIACDFIALLMDAEIADEARNRLDTLSLLAPDHPRVKALLNRP